MGMGGRVSAGVPVSRARTSADELALALRAIRAARTHVGFAAHLHPMRASRRELLRARLMELGEVERNLCRDIASEGDKWTTTPL